jgi:hypothetical protein
LWFSASDANPFHFISFSSIFGANLRLFSRIALYDKLVNQACGWSPTTHKLVSHRHEECHVRSPVGGYLTTHIESTITCQKLFC